MIAINTDSLKKRSNVLLRRGCRGIWENRAVSRWQDLKIGGVKTAVLNAPSKDRIMPGLLPDLLQFSGINLQLAQEMFVHSDALHASERGDAGHGYRVNVGPEGN